MIIMVAVCFKLLPTYGNTHCNTNVSRTFRNYMYHKGSNTMQYKGSYYLRNTARASWIGPTMATKWLITFKYPKELQGNTQGYQNNMGLGVGFVWCMLCDIKGVVVDGWWCWMVVVWLLTLWCSIHDCMNMVSCRQMPQTLWFHIDSWHKPFHFIWSRVSNPMNSHRNSPKSYELLWNNVPNSMNSYGKLHQTLWIHMKKVAKPQGIPITKCYQAL